MKLITCVKCSDVFALREKEDRKCSCGLSGGRYLSDGLHAEYYGPCFPLGFGNSSLVDALRNQPLEGLGRAFDAFVIPKDCPTMIKLDEHYIIEKVKPIDPFVFIMSPTGPES